MSICCARARGRGHAARQRRDSPRAGGLSLWPQGDTAGGLSSALALLVAGADAVGAARSGHAAGLRPRDRCRSCAHARLLDSRGQGHGVIGAGCMPRLIERIHRRRSSRARSMRAVCVARRHARVSWITTVRRHDRRRASAQGLRRTKARGGRVLQRARRRDHRAARRPTAPARPRRCACSTR